MGLFSFDVLFGLEVSDSLIRCEAGRRVEGRIPLRLFSFPLPLVSFFPPVDRIPPLLT